MPMSVESASASGSTNLPQPQNPGPAVPFSAAVAMLAPLPGQPIAHSVQPPTYEYGAGIGYGADAPNQERWDNMGTLFHAVREHARSTHYPAASVAALETVLIRLYLESPIGPMPQHNIAAIVGLQPPNRLPQPSNVPGQLMHGNGVAGSSHSSTEDP